MGEKREGQPEEGEAVGGGRNEGREPRALLRCSSLRKATVLLGRTVKLNNEHSRISSIFIHIFILYSTNIYYVPNIPQALCWILGKELMLCQNTSK